MMILSWASLAFQAGEAFLSFCADLKSAGIRSRN